MERLAVGRHDVVARLEAPVVSGIAGSARGEVEQRLVFASGPRVSSLLP